MKNDQKRLEASKQKAADSLQKLARSMQWLDADISAADRWARFDAVAKRFEVAFEYTWKAFKAALDSLGLRRMVRRIPSRQPLRIGGLKTSNGG
jgi:hypothetical protein